VCFQDRLDETQGVDLRSKLRDHFLRGVLLHGSERAPLLEPPLGCALVEPLDVELVDEQQGARSEHVGESVTRGVERIDVMKRDDRDGGVEGRVRLLELGQRDRDDVLGARPGVDRDDVVARGRQEASQLAVAGTDLQDACGHGGEIRQHEDGDLVIRHRIDDTRDAWSSGSGLGARHSLTLVSTMAALDRLRSVRPATALNEGVAAAPIATTNQSLNTCGEA
jgi:hypothetical protein